jgi:hypothetical protein
MNLRTAGGDVLTRLDENRLSWPGDAVLLFACLRDEVLRLPYFLEYYRALGVSRFVVIDNDSSDGTTALLREQPDVHLFHTAASYAGSRCGVHWLNAALSAFADGHWSLVVDADEQLVYLGSESQALGGLCERLESSGASALLTFLLDMYGAGPIRDLHYAPGTPFLTTAPFFDTDSYTPGSGDPGGRIPATGGARWRLFWKGRQHPGANPPVLTKIPLVRWSKVLALQASTHVIENVVLAPFTGALLHFKLFSDFAERAAHEARRGEHWQDAAQYTVYAAGLAADLALDPMYPGSGRLRDTAQLVELGLLVS